jgi:hypothetical protein
MWIQLIAQEITPDSIFISAIFNTEKNEISVQQKFKLNTNQDSILLHAWINAYSHKKTKLSGSKLEERKSDLYYAKESERGGIFDLKFYTTNGTSLSYEIKQGEKIIVNCAKNQDKNQIIAQYTLKIPDSKFTGYGVDEQKNYFLKYFFLQPFAKINNHYLFQPHLDMDLEMSNPTFYDIQFNGIENKNVVSYLNNQNNHFTGFLFDIPEMHITNHTPQDFLVDNKKIIFTYAYETTEFTLDIIKNQLDFLAENLGSLPENKLIITKKIQKNNSFFGLDDIEISKKLKLENFTPLQKESIQLFQLIAHEYINKIILTQKQKDFWIKGGLQSFLSIKYIENEVGELPKILGKMNNRKILGLKPFRSIYLFNVPLTERYNLMYSFLSRNGNDQVLSTPFDQMNKFNQEYVGNHRTGMLFRSMQDYLGEEEFESNLKKFVTKNTGKRISAHDFTSYFETQSSKPMTWFRENFLETDQTIDFRVKRIKINGDSLSIGIKNRTNYSGPFKVAGYNQSKIVYSRWLTIDKKSTIKLTIPRDSIRGFLVNIDSYLPELYDSDNYKVVGGLFHNSKNIAFSIFKGIEDPKYRHLIMIPRINFNNQDKLTLGLNLSNATFFPKEFTYRLSPTYSTGTGKLVGGTNLGYFSHWKTGIIERLSINTSYSYFNYTSQFSAQSIGTNAGILLRRKYPRKAEFKSISIGFQSINREISPTPTAKDLDFENYQLYDLGYNYANNGLIHDFSGGINLEFSNLFTKAIIESYYRIKLSRKNKIHYRLFCGYFFTNKTNSDSFDFGIGRVNDYKFRFQILDRVNTEGWLSQQFILADAGFKSLINTSVNQWIISNNAHINLNKRIGIFGDFAWYKNENQNPNFVYSSGFSFTAIEDFLELYFPIQSSLGFEPELNNYQNRIRFVFSFSLGAILSYWRRGKY